MRIRRADDADEAFILDRDRAEFGAPRGPHHATEWWVAGDAEIAYAGAYVDTDGVLRLERVWVAPDARGQGLQARFLRAREAWGRRQGCAWSRTYTEASNVASEANLARAGYWPVKVTTTGGTVYRRWVKPLSGPRRQSVPRALRG